MVNIYKTTVTKRQEAVAVLYSLAQRFPAYRLNFDLEDCDHILRVEAGEISSEEVIGLLQTLGFACEELFDEKDLSFLPKAC